MNTLKTSRSLSVLILLLTWSILTSQSWGQSGAQLYFDPSEIVKGLSKLANVSTTDTFVSTINLYTDPERKRVLAPGNDVTVRIEAVVPVGSRKGQYLSKEPALATAYASAKQGLTAAYSKDTGQLTLTFKRPYVFTDPRPGSASRTWDYELSVSLTIVGSGSGGAGGVKVLRGKQCISLFGIVSQKDEKQWKPQKGDHYTYIPQIEPKEFLDLGEMDTDAIYSSPHVAVFKWRPNTEGKSIRMRWTIKGDDVNTFEDVTTAWETAENPCCGENIVEAKPKATPTPQPQSLPPIKPSDVALKSTYVPRWRSVGKGEVEAVYDFAVFLELTGGLQATQISKVSYASVDIGLDKEQASAGSDTGKFFPLYYTAEWAAVVKATVYLKDGRKFSLERDTKIDESRGRR